MTESHGGGVRRLGRSAGMWASDRRAGARARGGGRCVRLVGSVAWLVSWSGSSLRVMNSIYI
jgi:hypothetical protein